MLKQEEIKIYDKIGQNESYRISGFVVFESNIALIAFWMWRRSPEVRLSSFRSFEVGFARSAVQIWVRRGDVLELNRAINYSTLYKYEGLDQWRGISNNKGIAYLGISGIVSEALYAS